MKAESFPGIVGGKSEILGILQGGGGGREGHFISLTYL